jgi:predicted transcriptional regulator
MATTTIKVSTELRDQINAHARARGTTASGFIAALLADDARRSRMAAFGRAMRDADQTYRDEFAEWDAMSAGQDA